MSSARAGQATRTLQSGAERPSDAIRASDSTRGPTGAFANQPHHQRNLFFTSDKSNQKTACRGFPRPATKELLAGATQPFDLSGTCAALSHLNNTQASQDLKQSPAILNNTHKRCKKDFQSCKGGYAATKWIAAAVCIRYPQCTHELTRPLLPRLPRARLPFSGRHQSTWVIGRLTPGLAVPTPSPCRRTSFSTTFKKCPVSVQCSMAASVAHGSTLQNPTHRSVGYNMFEANLA